MPALLFHKDVYIPDHAKKPLHVGALKYGNHATNVASGENEYGYINLPPEFTTAGATLIEVELNEKTGEVEKQVWRQKLDAEWDLCFPMIAGGFVTSSHDLAEPRSGHPLSREYSFCFTARGEPLVQ